MKPLVSKDKNGRYRIIKTDIPFAMLSPAIGKAIYEVVNKLGEYQELENKNKLTILPYHIGQKLKFVKDAIKIQVTVSKIYITKEIEIECVSEAGYRMIFTQKEFCFLEEEKE